MSVLIDVNIQNENGFTDLPVDLSLMVKCINLHFYVVMFIFQLGTDQFK